MKNYIFIFAITAIVVGFISCDKDTSADYAVTITVIEPEVGTIINSGDSLHMEIDFEGTRPINNLQVTAINNTTGDTLANYTLTTNDSYYPFHEHILPTAAVESDCKVVASAWDYDPSAKTTKEVTFTIHP